MAVKTGANVTLQFALASSPMFATSRQVSWYLRKCSMGMGTNSLSCSLLPRDHQPVHNLAGIRTPPKNIFFCPVILGKNTFQATNFQTQAEPNLNSRVCPLGYAAMTLGRSTLSSMLMLILRTKMGCTVDPDRRPCGRIEGLVAGNLRVVC